MPHCCRGWAQAPWGIPSSCCRSRGCGCQPNHLKSLSQSHLKSSQGGWLISPGWDGGGAVPRVPHVLVPVASVDLQGSREVGCHLLLREKPDREGDGGMGELCVFLPAPASLEWVLIFLFSTSLGLDQCGLKVCQAPGMSGLNLRLHGISPVGRDP